MRAVSNIPHSCFLGNMKKLFMDAEASMDELRDGTNTVRATVADDMLVRFCLPCGLTHKGDTVY